MLFVSYFLSIFLIAEALPAPEYEVIYSNNGWIPLTSGQVYHPVTPIMASNRHTNPDNNYLFGTEVATEKTVTREITVKDRNEDTECIHKDQRSCLYTKIEDVTYLNVESDFVPNVFKPDAITNKTSNQTGRRSKKISDVLFSQSDNKNVKSDTDNQLNEKSYEVTEQNELDVQNDATQGLGYFYQPANNYTNNLFKLLSKYNIKTSDALPNYALSRQNKVYYTPMKESEVFKPFNVQIPFRYNNLNHLPVDPLLAVFLSNYGYYLHGQYGIKNSYNNLYGYLASNNIHNNKPFGLYKVFSDRDSL